MRRPVSMCRPLCCAAALTAALTAALCMALPAAAQQPPPRSCEAEGADALDFWIGRWDLSWAGRPGTPQEGQTITGTNVIERVLDDCIIQENFSSPGFDGKSWSVFHPASGEWRQTWVDTQGAYLLFTGGLEGGVPVLVAPERTLPDGRVMQNRMTWKNITDDSFDWHYQYTFDGGTTWTDSWVIHYERQAPGQSAGGGS